MEGALQALKNVALSPQNGMNVCHSDTDRSPSISPAACPKWPRFPPNNDDESFVLESSAKMRRGYGGHAIGLDEENNPSPTRVQRRSHETKPEERQPPKPIIDPRIAALRSVAENVAPTAHVRPPTPPAANRPATPASLRRHAAAAATFHERAPAVRVTRSAAKMSSPLVAAASKSVAIALPSPMRCMDVS